MSVSRLALLAAEAGVVAPLLVVPGTLAVRRLFGPAWPELPWHRRLAYGWLASVWLLALVGASLQVVPVAGARLAVWAIAAGTVLAILARALPAWRRIPAHGRAGPAGAVAVALALLGVSLGLASLVDVPGPLVAGYGDLPAYYRVVENLARGRGLLVDFRVGDYSGEVYRLPAAFPLPVWVGAALRLVLPQSEHVVLLFCALGGAVALVVFAGRLAEACGPAARNRAGLVAALALVPLAAVPSGLHFVLGAITLPVLAMLLVALDALGEDRAPPAPPRVALAVVAALGAAATRPEGALMVGSTGALLALGYLARQARRRAVLAVAALAIVALAVAWSGGLDVGTLRGDLSLAYLHYQPDGAFRWHPSPYVRWWTINFDNAHESLGLPRSLTQRNPDILGQVARHPVAFGRWVGATLWAQLPPPWLALLALAGGVAIARGSLVEKAAGLGGILYAPVLLCLSAAISPRHVLPVLVALLLVAATRLELARHLARWPRATAGGCLLAGSLGLAGAAWSTADAYAIQRREGRVPYRRVLAAVSRHATPDSVVATNYAPLVSYGAGVPTVGNSILLETLGALTVKYRPDLIVIDDNRLDLPESYERFHALVTQGRLRLPGYRVLVDSPRDRFVLLARGVPGPSSGG